MDFQVCLLGGLRLDYFFLPVCHSMIRLFYIILIRVFTAWKLWACVLSWFCMFLYKYEPGKTAPNVIYHCLDIGLDFFGVVLCLK